MQWVCGLLTECVPNRTLSVMGKRKQDSEWAQNFARTWEQGQRQDSGWRQVTNLAGVLIPLAAVIFFLVALFHPFN